jgi:Flp pilus assembly protein TadD
MGARFGLALLGAGIIFAGGAACPAAAQNGVSTEASAGDALARNLRTLAENPRSLSALMGAGRASLEVGDAQAALTFFTRAEEIAPADGRIKMWVGSALVQVEQPRAALGFFDQALVLGVPEADLAADRGLAHDMLGDPRRAQRDYELVLRRGSNAEVTRRLALSLAISGERERALQLLEDQLLVRDRAAARTRALVLALTGDAAGAARAAEASMPGPQAAAMAPFLARLPSLSPAERALAVHFGHFPGDGQPTAPAASLYASRDAANAPAAAGAPDAGQPALGGRLNPVPEPVSTAPRRRPDTGALAASRSQTLSVSRSAEPAAQQVRPPVTITATAPETIEAGPSPAVPEPESGSRLADVAATIASLSDNAAPPAATPPRTRAAAPIRTRATAAAATPAKKKPAPAPEPSRVWVQVAGGADKGALPREYARLKAKAPRLLGSRTAWTTPANATNRLLVGPFPNGRDAQAFVNELAKMGVAGFAWTSAAGQKVERLASK